MSDEALRQIQSELHAAFSALDSRADTRDEQLREWLEGIEGRVLVIETWMTQQLAIEHERRRWAAMILSMLTVAGVVGTFWAWLGEHFTFRWK